MSYLLLTVLLLALLLRPGKTSSEVLHRLPPGRGLSLLLIGGWVVALLWCRCHLWPERLGLWLGLLLGLLGLGLVVVVATCGSRLVLDLPLQL